MKAAAKEKTKEAVQYKSSITREQFMFFEMRTTAKLFMEGLTDEEIISRIISENLFQYPTEKQTRSQALACIKRLRCLNDNVLVKAIATKPSETAKQICLYAMMKYNRLVWDFMVTVIGEKFRTNSLNFGKIDLNVYFIRLQEQIDSVAAWKENTVKKAKVVLLRLLVENEYLDSTKSDHLNPVWINSILESAIRDHGDEAALPAFNCLN